MLTALGVATRKMDRKGVLRLSLVSGTLLLAALVACDLFNDSPMGPATALAIPEAQLPRSVPRGYYALSNLVSNPRRSTHKFYKDIVTILFSRSATGAQRKSAIDSIGATLVGGVKLGRYNSIYLVRIPADPTNNRVFDAAKRLRRFPGVRFAAPDFVTIRPLAYQRPNDGPGWQRASWKINPHDVYASPGADTNWAFEAIGAPLAWGCSTGRPTTKIGIIDMGIHRNSDLTPNILWAGDTMSPTSDTLFPHGTAVASLVAAVGNNDSGITGMMWQGSLELEDVSARDTVGGAVIPVDDSGEHLMNYSLFYQALTAIAMDTPRAINFSIYRPAGALDDSSALAADIETFDSMFSDALSEAGTGTPLLVFAAGNNGKVSGHSSAYWSEYPSIKNVFPSQTIIVAGAAIDSGELDSTSSSGPLVDVAAPGAAVGTWVGSFSPSGLARVWGTSVAAPLVTGLAGLLFSFDPSLTVSQVRQKIIDGADSSGIGAGSFHLISAYKSLKLAASQRIGAPLCGNRVWSSDGNIIVDREGYATDTIASGTFYNGFVTVFHGGNRIYLGDSMLVNRTGSWELVEVDDSSPSVSGSFWSALGISHDGDTAAWVGNVNPEPSPTVAVSMEDNSSEWTLQTFSGRMANPHYDDSYNAVGYSSPAQVVLVPIRAHDTSTAVTIKLVSITDGSTIYSGTLPVAHSVYSDFAEDGQSFLLSYDRTIYGTGCHLEYRRLSSPGTVVDSTDTGTGSCVGYAEGSFAAAPGVQRRPVLKKGKVLRSRLRELTRP